MQAAGSHYDSHELALGPALTWRNNRVQGQVSVTVPVDLGDDRSPPRSALGDNPRRVSLSRNEYSETSTYYGAALRPARTDRRSRCRSARIGNIWSAFIARDQVRTLVSSCLERNRSLLRERFVTVIVKRREPDSPVVMRKRR